MRPTDATPRFEAVVFDMDGVVTDTASIHASAWKELFDEFLATRNAPGGGRPEPFDPDDDYRRYVDGRSREDGVVTFLAARGIRLDPGTAGDKPDRDTVTALAERKNRLFLDSITRQGVRAFPSTVDLVRRLREGGTQTALVSASQNAAEILSSAGVGDLFDVRVDGDDAASLGLAGKPEPAMFLEAARRLGVDPARAAVVEDAVAGVEAARRGGFGLVVGVDRGGHRPDLVTAGADIVVDDLGQLDLGAVRTDPWLLAYEGFDPVHEGHREALTALGNGYLASRGAAPESSDDDVHYPGTYLAGVYNRLTTIVHGRSVEDEHLVNLPNWLPFDVRLEDGAWWSVGGLEVLEERRELDLRRGVLARHLRLADSAGRHLRIGQRRLVSMARPHVAALETTFVAEGWSGLVHVRAGLDGRAVNNNVSEYRALANRHLSSLAAEEAGPETVVMETETSQSHIRIAVAARTTVLSEPTVPPRRVVSGDGLIAHELALPLEEGKPMTVEKVVAYATSRDWAVSSPRLAVLRELQLVGGWESLLAGHEQAWHQLWDRFGITVEGDAEVSLVLNLHVFHLLQSLSPHTAQVDAGVPARGLHGEGYRGHVFWDELFVFPLLNLRLPTLTRALLGYRWRRLDEARAAAKEAGLTGALFPWQSGSDGREETPEQLFNLRSERWVRDNSRLQCHVGLAVAYNVWQYYQATGDRDFLAEQGAELMIEVARLFADLATHDAVEDRYDIDGVMGPDEYHDAYPGAAHPGLRNNTYTNVLTAWVLWRAADVVRMLSCHHCGDLWERLSLADDEPRRWDRISRRLQIPFHRDGVISQFDGYEQLDELDWPRYRNTYGNIGRLDLILEAEGDTPNRYKLSKQADVLMLLYLLPSDELAELFGRLGYPLAPDTISRTVDYYLDRTAHGSTLSRVVHSWVLARQDPERSWPVFRDALRADLDDTQGGTTSEGIHLGAMAGTVDLVLRCYAGIAIRNDVLWFDPRPPQELGDMCFDIFYRGQRLSVRLSPVRLRIHLHPCAAAPIRVAVGGSVTTMVAGETHDVRISDGASTSTRDGHREPSACRTREA